MRYSIGDIVEVRCNIKAPWFEGIVESDDGENYNIKLNSAQLLSILHNVRFKRDLKTDKVAVKKHLDTIGSGHMHMRLKNYKDHKPK